MALEFLHKQARYNPYTEVVAFFAEDDELSIMFNVTRDALEYLEAASPLTHRQLLATFERHLDRILEVATKLYAAGPRIEGDVAYALRRVHFAEVSKNC
jgi:hypothetical protein